MSSLKRRIVGTALGDFAQASRSWLKLRSVSFQNPEKASFIANQILSDILVSKLPDDSSVFVDIGAHIGSVLSAVHRSNESVKIIAIEADPIKADGLRRAFDYCDVFECAVGEKAGLSEFYLHNDSGYNSMVFREDRAASDVTEVKVMELDSLFGDQVIDFIKIDVEGVELGVLIGGESVIMQSRPIIMFESTSLLENSLGYCPRKLWCWLSCRDYEIFMPDRLSHYGNSLDLGAFLDAHDYPRRTHNYFAVPKEKRNSVTRKARDIFCMDSSVESRASTVLQAIQEIRSKLASLMA